MIVLCAERESDCTYIFAKNNQKEERREEKRRRERGGWARVRGEGAGGTGFEERRVQAAAAAAVAAVVVVPTLPLKCRPDSSHIHTHAHTPHEKRNGRNEPERTSKVERQIIRNKKRNGWHGGRAPGISPPPSFKGRKEGREGSFPI